MRLAMIVVVSVLAALPVAGASLAGREIVVSSDIDRHTVPITLKTDGEAPEGGLVVREEGKRKMLPATLRNGALTFVVDRLRSGRRTYTVEARDASRGPEVRIEQRGDLPELEVWIDGELFTVYHYADKYKKPFLWPVNAEGGVGITRDWPMGEADKSADHPHHKSLWTAYGDVNGVDCWAEGGNSGFQRTDNVTWGSGDAYGWIRAVNIWEDKDHKPILQEEREYRFYRSPAGQRLFDVAVTFRAPYGDVKFGDTKEGGLIGVRIHDSLRERGGSGTVTTAAGIVGATAAWGKPAAWCDYSGTLEGAGVRGLTVFDHPGNLRHPTTWHIRDYGLMGANCFGYSYFTKGKENGDFLLEKGGVLSFEYRIYIHTGDVNEARVAEHYGDFASPPDARWAE